MLGLEPRAVVAPAMWGLWPGTWCAIDMEGEKRDVADPKGAVEPKPFVEPALATVLATRGVGVVAVVRDAAPLEVARLDGGGAASVAPSKSCGGAAS